MNKISDIVVSFICILLLAGLFLTCNGCKIVRNLKQSSRDSTVVNTSGEGNVRKDSSGSKTDKIYTKETIYYQPIKDTNSFTINTPAPIIRIIESGREQTEQAQIIVDTSWKAAFNSLAVTMANKETKSTTKVGPSLIEWILIAGLGLLLLKNFLPFTIKKI